MACGAVRRKTHPCLVKVLARKERSLRRCNVLQIVAGAAAYARMFAVEGKTCRGVIKPLRSWIPMHHLEIDAVMIGMALHTSHAGRPRSRERCMKAFVLLDLILNFSMAIKTFKGGRLHGDLVTLDAVCGSAQALMRPCQRSRRDLGPRLKAKTQYKTDPEERAKLRIAASDTPALPTISVNALHSLLLSPSNETFLWRRFGVLPTCLHREGHGVDLE